MIGPKLRLVATCGGCDHEVAVRYDCQSDWGYNYYCTHAEIGRRRKDCSETPEWCPELIAAKAAFLAAARKGAT